MKLTIRTTVAALAAVAVLGLSACGDDDSDDNGGGDATATSGSEETSGDDATDEATEGGENGEEEPTGDEDSPGGESQDVFDVGLGDCISNFNAEEQISELTVIPCEDEHDQEVFGVFEVPDGDFPGSDAFEEQVSTECVAEFETFVGVPYNESVLDVQWLEPTEESWEQGDRELVCTVFDPEGPVTGTLEGAAR